MNRRAQISQQCLEICAAAQRRQIRAVLQTIPLEEAGCGGALQALHRSPGVGPHLKQRGYWARLA
jgi:hypothetical protein